MVIFKCYFSGEIAHSYKKKTNNNNISLNIELGKTNRLKHCAWCKLKNEINNLCVNKQGHSMKIKSICRNQWRKKVALYKQIALVIAANSIS